MFDFEEGRLFDLEEKYEYRVKAWISVVVPLVTFAAPLKKSNFIANKANKKKFFKNGTYKNRVWEDKKPVSVLHSTNFFQD